MLSSVPLPLAAITCFMTALAFSLYGTPVAARAAMRFGIVDVPDGSLKRHRGPVPYLGGLAVYVSFILTMALVFDFDKRVLGLLLGGTILVLLGLIDDFGVLGVWPKFLGQGFVTIVLIKSDIAIHIGVLPAWANLALTVLWLVGLTNAFNIIDIMDGLATGTAFVAASFLLIVAFLNGQGSIALMTATLMGSLLGFLRYNVHPARIFMGDTGSLFIGMMLGALAMIGKYDRINKIGYFSPLLILAVPIFDTIYVMALRLAKGRNPFKGSPDHFALRLRRGGLPVRAVAAIAWSGGAAMGALGIFNLYLPSALSVLLILAAAATLVMLGIAMARVPVEPGEQRAEMMRAAAPPPMAGRAAAILAAPQAGPDDYEATAVREARGRLAEWRRR